MTDARRNTIEMIGAFLDEKEYGYDIRDDNSCIRTGFQGHNARFDVRISMTEDNTSLGVFAYLAPIVPEGSRSTMAEAIVRANYGLNVGRFELDMTDGTIEFFASIPVIDGTITTSQFEYLFFTTLATVDRYAKSFNRLLYGDDLSPAEVIAEVEMTE